MRPEIMQMVTSWMKQGIQQGIQQGQAATLIKLLTFKLGTLDPVLITQLHNLSPAKLDELGVALFNFQQPQDLITWLQNNVPAS